MKKIELYLPSKDKVGVLIDDTRRKIVKDEVVRSFSSLFGGCTIVPAAGSWTSETGEVIEEKIEIIYSYTNKKDVNETVKKLARLVKQELNQESVMITLPNPVFI